ncbi:hypothetical protein ASM33_02480 [Wolbachia endosymbiont of Folsomia candida]|nr:hypothetical protein ASM33_02480 [Wolbachia endosymbiont of Folsomia candida]
MLVVGAVIGSLQGLLLSSRVLSPLVVGGILGFAIAALFSTFQIIALSKLGDIDLKEIALKRATHIVTWTVTSSLIGVGLAAAANAMFPGVMLAIGSPALVGAIIGAIAPTAGFLLPDQVSEYIISPVIERFSSKEKEDDPSLCCSL